MFLTIDEAKIRESLANSAKPTYVVTPSYLVIPEVPILPTPSATIGGTMAFGAMLISPEARKDFLSMRRKIESSGVPLKGIDELTLEIDEMRGRSK
jgi:hypothetical protein